MKRAVIILIEIALLFALLRMPFMQYLLEDVQNEVSGWFTAISQMEERNRLADLRERISPHIENLNGYQQDYVYDIVSSSDKLKQFHKLYCIDKDKNPYVYGSTLLFLCNEIRQSGSLK